MKTQQFISSDPLIIIFAKEPVPGRVKTRLIPTLGEAGAAKLYQGLLSCVIDNVVESHLSSVCLCITPESRMTYFTRRASSMNIEISVQEGHHLGLRMYNAMALALEKFSKVILIGSDCPFLRHDDLQQAISSLDANDMVFSPAKDGGFVLVGANKMVPGVFDNIDWGTDQVMMQTRKVLRKLNVSWHELSEQNDIDVEDDLKYLRQHPVFEDILKLE